MTKSDVNSVLYGHQGLFVKQGETPPFWSLRRLANLTAVPAASANGATTAPKASTRPSQNGVQPPPLRLYAWQADALEKWRRAGHRGVIEAVTGTGKTLVGVAAAREAINKGGRVQIVVPGVELLEQWNRELRSRLPGIRVGSLGGGYFSDFRRDQIVVSIVNSAREYDLGDPPGGSLLAADECHRYGSGVNAAALDERFSRRMGLTATYRGRTEASPTTSTLTSVASASGWATSGR